MCLASVPESSRPATLYLAAGFQIFVADSQGIFEGDSVVNA